MVELKRKLLVNIIFANSSMENLSFFTYILENITISNNGLYNLSRSLFTTPNNNFNFQIKNKLISI